MTAAKPSARISAERALEIIAAYGADSRRWPADERAAALLCASTDPAVAAALAAAGPLDALLAGWAGDAVPRAPFDAAALIPAAAGRPGFTPRQRWWAGGAVAAGLAATIAGLLLVPALPELAPMMPPAQIAASRFPDVSPVPSAAGESQDLADAEVFATVFTPTADEDELI